MTIGHDAVVVCSFMLYGMLLAVSCGVCRMLVVCFKGVLWHAKLQALS